jgi:hypothetical protein
MRPDVAREMAEIFVGPGGTDLTIDAGLALLAIPAEAEAVAVQAIGGFLSLPALLDQRMDGGCNVLLKSNRLSAIGNPAAHGPFGSGEPPQPSNSFGTGNE